MNFALNSSSTDSGFSSWLKSTYGGVESNLLSVELNGGANAASISLANDICSINSDTTTLHNESGIFSIGSFGETCSFCDINAIQLSLSSGPAINEISTDTRFSTTPVDTAIVTEHALRTYLENLTSDFEFVVGVGTYYPSIKDATDAVVLISSYLNENQRALIRVLPGIYAEAVLLPRYCDLIGVGGCMGHFNAVPSVTISSASESTLTIDNQDGPTVNKIQNVYIYCTVINDDGIGRPAVTSSNFTNAVDVIFEDCLLDRVNGNDNKDDSVLHLVPTEGHSCTVRNSDIRFSSVRNALGAYSPVSAIVHGTGKWYFYSSRFFCVVTPTYPPAAQITACIANDLTYKESYVISIGNKYYMYNSTNSAIAMYIRTTGNLKSINDDCTIATGGPVSTCIYGKEGTAYIIGMQGHGGADDLSSSLIWTVSADIKIYTTGCSFSGTTVKPVFIEGGETAGNVSELNTGSIWLYNEGSGPLSSSEAITKLYTQQTVAEGSSTLGLYTEQPVEVGSATCTEKIKILVNGTEYWLGLEPV